MKLENKERAEYLIRVLTGTDHAIKSVVEAIARGARTENDESSILSIKVGGYEREHMRLHGTSMDYVVVDMSLPALKAHRAKVIAELETL